MLTVFTFPSRDFLIKCVKKRKKYERICLSENRIFPPNYLNGVRIKIEAVLTNI